MSFFLQNPALLPLLALAGLPLLVHLLSRARPPSYHFSNIAFLRRILRRTARIRRPKEWLLLALRTLALFTLAAAFLSPFLLSKNASLPGEKSTAILLIDRSASMAARDGTASRFEAACAEAARYLAASKPSSANLVWIDASPAAVFPEPGPNLDFLTESLQQSEPRPEPGALDAAFDLALRQFANSKGRTELIIISDFQASAWRNFSPSAPPGIEIITRRVADSSPPNVAITRLLPQPSSPVVGQELTLIASLRNFSPDPVRTQLTLDAGGSRQSQPIDIGAWGETEASFTLRPAAATPLPITASIEPDAFPHDDSRHAVVRVRDSLRLLISSPENSPESALLGKIASSLPWLEAGNNPTTPADIRFLAPWNGENPAELLKAARSGETIIVQPAPSCPTASLATLLDLPATGFPASFPLDQNDSGWSVAPEESHPAIQIFRNGDFGNPFAGKFKSRLRLPQSLPPNSSLIARFSDQIPALIEFPTSGAPILLWNLPIDPAASDWSLQGVFLPTIAEILLRTRPNAVSADSDHLPGNPLFWSSADPAHAASITLAAPDGSPIPIQQTHIADGLLWQSSQPATPGLHRWQVSGQTIDFTAVNFPESESDLRPLDSSPSFGKLASSEDSLIRHASLSRGLPLWPILAAAALFLLSLESLLLRPKPL